VGDDTHKMEIKKIDIKRTIEEPEPTHVEVVTDGVFVGVAMNDAKAGSLVQKCMNSKYMVSGCGM